MSPIDRILRPYAEGKPLTLSTGRPLHDLEVTEQNGQARLRPLLHVLAREGHQRHGMALLRFNLALGLTHEFGAMSEKERTIFLQGLRSVNLNLLAEPGVGDSKQPLLHCLDILRAIHAAVRSGRTVPPFILVIEFAEDLAPHASNGGTAASPEITQFLCLLASDYVLRNKGVLLLVTGIESHLDERVIRALPQVHLPQPGRDEKRACIETALAGEVHKSASFEAGLSIETVANLAAGTPNASIEQILLASARMNEPVTARQISAQKSADIARISESTLQLLDTSRVADVALAGRTIRRPQELIRRWAHQLRAGNPHTPMNILLCGAPSTGKTDLALLAAQESGTPACQLVSPKGGIVGQSERQSRVQWQTLIDLAPSVGFIDELTEAYPTQRGGTNLDGGSSAAVMAAMLQALADRSREGRSLLIAATNRPAALDVALASRFLFLPVLSPVADDYPHILQSIIASLRLDAAIEPNSAIIKEAGGIFYEKRITPRGMRAELVGLLGETGGKLDADLLREAASDACETQPRARMAAEFADLAAIRATTRRSFFPWHGEPDYPLPPYLSAIVHRDGSLDWEALDARLAELRPHVSL